MFNSLNPTIDDSIISFFGLELIEHRYMNATPHITDRDREQMLDDLRKCIHACLR